MSWKDRFDGERAACWGERYDREHCDRMERARHEYRGSADRDYADGYQHELERQEQEIREERAREEEAQRRLATIRREAEMQAEYERSIEQEWRRYGIEEGLEEP